MQAIKSILLTGGGTAGHVNPALAIGSALASEGTRFLFVGVRGRVEEEVVPREGIPIRYVRASGFPAGFSAALAKFLLNLLIGSVQSAYILLRFRPDIIVGTGGYVSAPVIMAASFLRKIRLCKARVFLHEQNAVPGKLNRLMGRAADRVLVTFPETLMYFPKNGALVGYPLRRRIAKVGREEARQRLDFMVPEGRKIVLVFGGSQGSRIMNRALIDALGGLIPARDRLFIIHGVGLFKSREYHAIKDTEERLRGSYSVEQLQSIESFYIYRAFFHNIELLYALSDLVVARAGAGSLSEISAMGLPALIIPKSNLPGDHQVMNARAMERAGGAEILYEQVAILNGRLSEWIDGKVLAEKILSLLQDDDRLRRMSRHSHSFLNQNALALIEQQILGNSAVQLPDSAVQPTEASPLPENAALLASLEKAHTKLRSAYKPERVISRPQDLAYLKNRASSLLLHPDWQERNVGVKLLGLLHAKEKVPSLVTLFFDREPAPLLKRIMGGDFKQVGFIRRNIISALVRLNECSPEVEKALLMGLADPYYEVRVESAHAAAYFGDRLSSQEPLIAALTKLLADPIIDVAAAAAEALGKIGNRENALPVLLSMWDTKFWRVRAAVLRGILYLVERGEATDYEMLEKRVPQFILTSTDFKPQFEIRSAYHQLMESVSRRKARGSAP